MKTLVAFLALAAVPPGWSAKMDTPAVTTVRVPDEGIQPQLVERDGIVHLIYYKGADGAGDLYYTKSRDYGRTFSKPIRVNTAEKAIAAGTIRGAQLAVGANGRVHVAWNGVAPAGHLPMLYTRLNDAGTAFEPERNLIHAAYGLDGGGSLAADARGNVYVFWHAPVPGTKGEQNRRVWVARSSDAGKTFEPEKLALEQPIGACGCCGMKAYADANGQVYVLFRSADRITNRDIWLLSSRDRGRTFQGSKVSHWNIGACVMSSADLVSSDNGVLAAWETEKQTYFGKVANGAVSTPIAAPGVSKNRKYPVLAVNSRGEALFAWVESGGWKKTGTASWQLYDRDLRPEGAAAGSETVPVWSMVAAFARPDGSFVVVY